MMNGSTSREDAASEPLTGRYSHRRGAKALVTSGRSVLLVRERHADGTPFWTLPGGGVEAYETPTEGLHRELVEELGCRGHVSDPLGAFWYVHDSLDDTVTVYTVFECALYEAPTANAGEGIVDARWVDAADLPARTLPQVRYLCATLVAGAGQRPVADD